MTIIKGILLTLLGLIAFPIMAIYCFCEEMIRLIKEKRGQINLTKQSMEFKLNLGCGYNILGGGWINLDSLKLPGVDVIHDIEKTLPFPAEQFDEVLCQDVLEHIEYIPVLKDILRVMKKGGTLTIRVPHFTSRNNALDPTHKKVFCINTFDFFVQDSDAQTHRSYFDFSFSSCCKAKIEFERSKLFFLNPLIEKLVNSSSRIQKIYESTFLSRFFPACNIIIKLIK